MLRTRLIACLSAAACCVGAETRYTVDLADRKGGQLLVTVEATCGGRGCDFQMPAWSATYQIRDFAQHVTAFSASTAAGKPLGVSKTSPSTWRLSTVAGGNISVRYRVRADRPGPFGSSLSEEYAHLDLAQVLAYPEAAKDQPFRLAFKSVPKDWRIAIELEEESGEFISPNYSSLVDTPVHLSAFEESLLHHRGSQIRIAALGRKDSYNLGLLRDTVLRVVTAGTSLMGDVPFDSYTFVYHFADVPGGGMEYRNGTVIYGPADCSGCRLAELTAHEFFHAWNVKRIRPASLVPVDYVWGNTIPTLWFAEGVTSSYAHYLLLEAGLLKPAAFLRHLARLVEDYESRPASRTQSAEQASVEAWLERHAAYGRPDRSVSYYLQGELIGYVLDLAILHATGGRRGMDDLMRDLNEEHGKTGLPYDDIQAIEDALTRVAGVDMSAHVDRLVRSPAPIDWNHYLAHAGYRLDIQKMKTPEVGLQLTNPPGGGLLVAAVEPSTHAEESGFRTGDRVVSVEGRAVTAGLPDFHGTVSDQPEKRLRVEVERHGRRLILHLERETKTHRSFQLVELDSVTPAQIYLRRRWLRERSPVSQVPPPAPRANMQKGL